MENSFEDGDDADNKHDLDNDVRDISRWYMVERERTLTMTLTMPTEMLEREEESSNGALIALLCHHSQLDRVTVSLFVLHFDRDIRQIPDNKSDYETSKLVNLRSVFFSLLEKSQRESQGRLWSILSLMLLKRKMKECTITAVTFCQHPLEQ